MGRADKNDPLNKGQRFVARVAAERLLFLGGNVERFQPVGFEHGLQELVARVGGRQLGEQTALTVANDDHLLQGGIATVRVQFPHLCLQRFPQPGSRVDQGIAAVVNEVPELATLPQHRIGRKRVGHLGPPHRTAEGAMHEDDRHASDAVRLRQINVGGDSFLSRKKLQHAKLPDKGLVQRVGGVDRRVRFEGHGAAAHFHLRRLEGRIQFERRAHAALREFRQAAIQTQQHRGRHRARKLGHTVGIGLGDKRRPQAGLPIAHAEAANDEVIGHDPFIEVRQRPWKTRLFELNLQLPGRQSSHAAVQDGESVGAAAFGERPAQGVVIEIARGAKSSVECTGRRLGCVSEEKQPRVDG